MTAAVDVAVPGTMAGMDLVLTVLAPGDAGVPADVLVSAEPGTRLGQLRADLLVAVGRREGAIHCQGRALADDAVLGQPPLLHGALLTVGRPGPVPRHGLLELEVYAGPAAGHRHPLGVGEHAVGRSPDAAIRLDLSRESDRLLFLTATPHQGDVDQYQHFLRLLDADQFVGLELDREMIALEDSPWFSRRIKEELKDFDGRRLFTERRAITRDRRAGNQVQ